MRFKLDVCYCSHGFIHLYHLPMKTTLMAPSLLVTGRRVSGRSRPAVGRQQMWERQRVCTG